jgi:uncharacterized membrane protein YedE/YeeE
MDAESSRRPYVAGALAGLLAVTSVWISTEVINSPKYLGASTTFVRAAGLVEQSVAREHVATNAYYESKGVKVDWQMMFVVGIFGGAFVSSLFGWQFRLEGVPPIRKERFGSSVLWRACGAFLGGVVAMFGARLAGGCPSGHGLSGLMQLSVSGYLAMAGFFGAGVLVANLVYRSKGASE